MPAFMQLRKSLRWQLFAISLCLFLSGCFFASSPDGTDNINLRLGNPSRATTHSGRANNYLMQRPQYVMSYNAAKGIANWVSWQLNASWLGTLPRIPFLPDPTLPDGWYQVHPDDYTGSGFDRGHLVPAADRDRTAADVEAVFVMTNIMPQAPDNNRGAWEKLERYCRELAQAGKELYIIAGGVDSGGVGDRGRQTTLTNGRVTVPAHTWKVVVVLDRPNMDLKSISPSTRVIAVIMPNRQGIKNDWREFRVSVDDVEQLTGYDFLTALPKSLQNTLESKIDHD